jgi:glycosyltransferase involved in cell wall biosynthesis
MICLSVYGSCAAINIQNGKALIATIPILQSQTAIYLHPLLRSGVRIAILNPWFLIGGGGSKVVDVLAAIFPQAEFFTLFYKESSLPSNLRGKAVHTSFLHRIPWIRHLYRLLLPLFPFAAESLDVRGFDLVLSCDASVIKGVIVDQDALHICYCHTPIRYAWDLYRTFGAQAPLPAKPIFYLTAHYLRLWDFLAAQRVDLFIANSNYISRRIRTYYRRESTVIYPPVDTGRGYISCDVGNYYLSVGRLTHTKRLDLIVAACNRLGRRLIIAGTGREEARLKAMAGPTIEFLGRVSDADIPDIYARCSAFIFAADEDFGIVPVEAQSFGRPVIAYGCGGVLETVLAGRGDQATGVFFPEQTVESMMSGILRFEEIRDQFDPAFIRAHAQKFDIAIFTAAIQKYIGEACAARVIGESAR